MEFSLPLFRCLVLTGSACFGLSHTALLAQDQRVLDSLHGVFKAATHDTTRAEALLAITEQWSGHNMDTVHVLCQRALSITAGAMERKPLLSAKEFRTFERIRATAYNNIGAFHFTKGNTDSALYFIRKALSVHKGIDNVPGIADALNNIGVISGMRGEYKEQERCLREALALYRSRSDRSREAAASNNIATWFSDMSMPDSAFIYWQHALDIYSALNDREGVANAHLNIGGGLRETGKPLEALVHFSISEQLYDSLALQGSLARVFGNIADIYTDHGLREEAMDYHQRALDLSLGMGDKGMEATQRLNIGSLLETMDEHDLALGQLRQALDLYEEVGDQSGQAIVLGHMGDALKSKGQRKEALEHFERSLAIAQEIGSLGEESTALYKTGHFMADEGDLNGALRTYRSSLEMDVRGDDQESQAHNRVSIGQVLLRQEQPAEAEKEARMALLVAQAIGHVELQRRAADLLNQVLSRQGRWKEAWEMQALARRMQDSSANREQSQRLLKLQLRSDFVRQRTVDSLAHSNETARLESARTIQQLRADRNRNRAWTLGSTALLLLGGGTAFFVSDRKRRKARADLREARLEAQALRAQMNPHFLFNALNSINDYVQENEAQLASDYLTRFAKLMRQVLEASRQDEISLRKELSILRQYIELEQMRLQGKFEFAINVSPEVDADEVKVPPMILQPFVENSIWHGLSRKEGRGILTVEVAERDGAIVMSVQDDGIGRVASGSTVGTHHSMGLGITEGRLQRISGDNGAQGGFGFVEIEQGTRVEVTLPL